MQNSFINKVTRVHKVQTVANSINLWFCLVVFLEFILVDGAEISHMNTPQNSSRLPGSYEEAPRKREGVHAEAKFKFNPDASLTSDIFHAQLSLRRSLIYCVHNFYNLGNTH